MVEARNFIPGSQIAFGIKVIYHGNAFRRCRGSYTRQPRNAAVTAATTGKMRMGFSLLYFLLSVDDNRKKRERKEAQYPGPHRQLLQLFKNAPGRLDTDRVRIAFCLPASRCQGFFLERRLRSCQIHQWSPFLCTHEAFTAGGGRVYLNGGKRCQCHFAVAAVDDRISFQRPVQHLPA